MKPAYTLGLADAAAAVANRETDAAALAASCLERIREQEPRVAAWAWIDHERALAAARHRRNGPLAGVPIGVKDIIDVAGMPTGMGSPIYADHWPAQSAALVRKLEKAGAFALGKTVTTEFAFMVPAKTRNPWNPAHTPGGSSSGSAAAVACGMVPAAVGTQTNGSMIRPAAYCGVVGYKPGWGRIATDGVLPFSHTLDQPGVFARSVQDAALLASCLARHVGDISRDIEPLRTTPRMYAVKSPVWEKAEVAQRERFAADIEALRAAGAEVTVRELPQSFDGAHAVHRTIMLAEAARGARPLRARYREQFSDYLNAALDEGEAISEAAYQQALSARRELIRAFSAFLDDEHAAVLTPPAPGEAPEGLGATGDPAFCTIWTLLGVPAISIPTGLGPRGLPLGLQIVARPMESNYLLAVAAWCESHLPFDGLLARE